MPASARRVAFVDVDPKRVRHFAKAAGRLAKNDPIDAETIAWFAETFPDGETRPHDPERDEMNHLVQARAVLTRLEEGLMQQREHRQPTRVAQVCAVPIKILRAERRKLEAAIAAKIKTNRWCGRAGLARRPLSRLSPVEHRATP